MTARWSAPVCRDLESLGRSTADVASFSSWLRQLVTAVVVGDASYDSRASQDQALVRRLAVRTAEGLASLVLQARSIAEGRS